MPEATSTASRSSTCRPYRQRPWCIAARSTRSSRPGRHSRAGSTTTAGAPPNRPESSTSTRRKTQPAGSPSYSSRSQPLERQPLGEQLGQVVCGAWRAMGDLRPATETVGQDSCGLRQRAYGGQQAALTDRLGDVVVVALETEVS